MTDALTPEGFVSFRRQQLLDLTQEEYRMWQHHPITAAYLQFLDDYVEQWRGIAADLVETGAFQLRDPHEDKNPDVVRGRLVTARLLRQLDLEQIHRFYGVEPEEEPLENDFSQDD